MHGTVALARIAHTEEEIRTRVRELGAAIRDDYGESRPLLVSLLKGSVIFLADLVRATGRDCDIDFMSISSYGPEHGLTGVVRIVKDLEEPLEGRDVLVVEDLVDTGLTLSYLVRTLRTRQPASLKICTLVDKAVRRIADLDVHYVGFESTEFLVGYGLDYQGRYRNLPHILAVADPSVLASRPDALLSRHPDLVFPGPGSRRS